MQTVKRFAEAKRFWVNEMQTRYGMLHGENVPYMDVAKCVSMMTNMWYGEKSDSPIPDKREAANYLCWAKQQAEWCALRFACDS